MYPSTPPPPSGWATEPAEPARAPAGWAAAPAEPVRPYAAAPPRGAELEVPPAPLCLVALWDLWRRTTGTLSLDLSRRKMRGGGPGDSLWRVSAAQQGQAAQQAKPRGRPPAQPRYGAPPGQYGAPAGQYGSAPAGQYGAPGGGYGGGGSAYPARSYQGGLVDLPSLSFMNTGARIKLMRHVNFGPKVEVVKSSGLVREQPAFDLGLGLAFELDTAELQPQARLKFRDLVSLKALPYPSIKIQKRLRVPESTWGVRLSYECPLEAIGTFYRPPARLMLSIDNMHSNGVQLTQAGLEFNYAALFGESQRTQLRAAGLLSLPRELPIVEGQPLVGADIKRLGIKTEW
ncbi:hypothetical protein C2E20_1663 [Micractinium conductrix]|uniref:Uncharacterized protein n=1 Tax=Micractinium conductrix TaxID=554055 RepID=A0A2P6VP53_9CHLO|nr:hypothetical protein C2E20_1663 [Micractinium conductrix]|eukprot:PSC75878.1 hypothetical protein C2E20_1663 [Micractinium conductrix]